MQVTFENLPQAVTDLTHEVCELKKLLIEKHSGSSPEQDELLSIQQAGKLLMLSVPTLYGYVQRSAIPVSKRGKKLYFSRKDLISWIKQGKKKTSSEIQAEADQHFANKKGRK